MPSNDIEVFEHLTADQDTAVEIDYFTYAIFAVNKKNWIELFKKNNNRLPNQGEIDAWISQLTDYNFYQMRIEAADFFHNSAEEHLADYIEHQKKEAVETSILSEVQSVATRVKSFTSPLRHLGIALLMAILAPIVLGGIVFLLAVFDRSFPIRITIPALQESRSFTAPQGAPSGTQ